MNEITNNGMTASKENNKSVQNKPQPAPVLVSREMDGELCVDWEPFCDRLLLLLLLLVVTALAIYVGNICFFFVR